MILKFFFLIIIKALIDSRPSFQVRETKGLKQLNTISIMTKFQTLDNRCCKEKFYITAYSMKSINVQI